MTLDLAKFVLYVWLPLTVIVHVMLAFGIWTNAAERERDKKPLMYTSANGWGLATLLCGIFGVIAYWLIHHSALRKLYSGKDKSDD